MVKESGDETEPQDLGRAATVPVVDSPPPSFHAPPAPSRVTASDERKHLAALPGLVVKEALHGNDLVDLPPSIGERFGDLSFLGRGGMGTVYRGWDKQLSRDVAIKFVQGHDAARFLREARAQARINHDNVCKIYDVGQADGQPYITMQLVRGQSLSDAAKEMTLEEKIKVIREAASALHEAHRLGLVHRDVKPSNILVERSDDGRWRPFVMDFGLARIVGELGETVTGQIAGTPAYMAPEQVRGEIRSLDRRTDVYSLGATFYEILSGRTPFVDEHPWKLLMRIDTEDAPALRSICKSVPLDLETIVMKCLERDPTRRYESARALGEDLQRYLDGEPVLARKASVRYLLVKRARKHKVAVSLVTLGVILALILTSYGIHARRVAAEEARIAQELGEDVKEMQLFMRYAYSLPLHDIERERAVVRKRIGDIEAKMTAAGAVGRGPALYAIGRGYLALQEPEKALTHLKEAEATGYTSPEFAYALGRAMSEIYRAKMEAVRRIADTKKREAQQAELDAAYEVPALSHLRAASNSRLEHPAYVEGLIALTEERYEDALRLVKQAQNEAPWFYDATLLEAETLYALGSKFRVDASFDYDKMTAHFSLAMEAYRRAAEMGASDPMVHEGTCKLLVQQIYADKMTGNNGLAKSHFDLGKEAGERLIKSSPQSPSAYVYRAWVHLSYRSLQYIGDVEPEKREMIRLVEDAVKMQPDNSLAQWLLGDSWCDYSSYLLRRGRDIQNATEQALASYQKALDLDGSFHWPAQQVVYMHQLQAFAAERRGDDPSPYIARAQAALARALEIAPDAPLAQERAHDVQIDAAIFSIRRGQDPTRALDAAQAICDKRMAQAPNDAGIRAMCSSVPRLKGELAMATGEDPTRFFEQQQKLLMNLGSAKAAFYFQGMTLSSRARHSLYQGQSPVADATRAIEMLRGGGEEGVLRIGPAVLMLLRWHVAQKTAKARLFEEPLQLLLPLLNKNCVDPEPLVHVAAIHERNATWLLEQKKDPSDKLAKGFEFVAGALQRNPHFPPALATRGELHLVAAHAARTPAARKEAARLAKESFDAALSANKYLARETEQARKEVDRLLAEPTSLVSL